jgi:hypothetical protein
MTGGVGQGERRVGELEVIGAGFGRTGTLSLRAALDELGYGPVCHGVDIAFRPTHVLGWRKYYRTGQADWRKMYKRFRSAIDYPVCCAWKELAAEYPDAKIILTTRDPDRWWESTNETIYPGPREVVPDWSIKAFPLVAAYVEFVEGIVWEGLFDGRFSDKEHAIKVFERHIEDVKATADPDRLLVYNVAEGWGPLCEFLNVPVPSSPFPHVNDKAELQRWNKLVATLYRLIPPVTLVAGGYGAYRFVRARRARRA